MSCVPDGNSVYWLVSGAIKRTSTDGSVTTTVASVVDAVRLVSTDATAVYYTTYSSLMAIPK
jgi:hypothetical protein